MQRPALTILLLALVLLCGGGLWYGSKRLATGSVPVETLGPASAAQAPEGEPGAAALVAPIGPEDQAEDVRVAAMPVEEARTFRAETAPSGSIWLAGRIVLPAGTPADEEVFVLARGKKFAGDREDPKSYKTRALGDGTFRVAFAAGTKTGWISLQARYVYLDRSVRLKTNELPDELLLEPRLGGRLVARVMPPPGLELEKGVLDDVVVVAQSDTMNQVPRAMVRVADGLYAAGGIAPAADYEVEAASRKFADGQVEDVEVVPAETTEVVASLDYGAGLKGRVVDSQETGLEGVEVRILSKSGRINPSYRYKTVKTGAEGVFEAAGIPPGDMEIRLETDGFVELREDLGEVANGESRDGIRLVLEQGNWVAGIVQWPDGRPGVGTTVKVTREKHGSLFATDKARSEKSDAEGRFRVNGLGGGPFEVSASAKGKKRGERWHAEQASVEPNTANIVLVLAAGGSFVGRVVDDEGTPVAKFRVTAKPDDESPYQFRGGDRITETFTSEDGAFELSNLFDGEWNVVANADGHGRSAAQRVSIPSASGAITLVAPRAARLSGVVRDDAGAPLAGARVSYRNPHRSTNVVIYDPNSNGVAVSDSEGAFEFESLAPGEIELEAEKSGFGGTGKHRFELAPGSSMEDVVLVMLRPARLTGEVDPSAGRVAGRLIRISGPDSRRTESDRSGRFAADGLPPGDYHVYLEPDEEAVLTEDRMLLRALRQSVEVELLEGRATHVVLGAPPEHPIRVHGRVTEAGAAAADILVTSSPTEGSRGKKVVARTDRQGRYELTVDGAGSYHFSVGKGLSNAVGYGREVPDGEAVELDFALPACRLSGTLRGPGGAPIAGKRIDLTCERPTEDSEGWAPHTTETTDEAGAFVFDNLAAGTYTLRAGGLMPWETAPDAKTYGRVVLPDLELEQGGSLEGIDVKLPIAGSIDVTVFGPDGGPLAGAQVTATDDGGRYLWRYYPATTSAGGKVRLKGVAAGVVRVTADKGESASPTRTVKVFEGQTAVVELVVN